MLCPGPRPCSVSHIDRYTFSHRDVTSGNPTAETMYKQHLQIQTDAEGFGMTTTGHAPIIVQSVTPGTRSYERGDLISSSSLPHVLSPGGAADRGGLKEGDALLELNGEDVTDCDSTDLEHRILECENFVAGRRRLLSNCSELLF